jgi:hypothetical protein
VESARRTAKVDFGDLDRIAGNGGDDGVLGTYALPFRNNVKHCTIKIDVIFARFIFYRRTKAA